MNYFGKKEITLDQVLNDFENSILSHCHFILGDQDPSDEFIKRISQKQMHLLMLLHLSGVHFLEKLIRESNEFDEFSQEDKIETYCLCDGIGTISPSSVSNLGGRNEWIHVKESSVEAIHRAEIFAKNKLIDLYNRL